MLLRVPMGQANAFQYGIVKSRVAGGQEVDDEETGQHQQHDVTLLRAFPIQFDKICVHTLLPSITFG